MKHEPDLSQMSKTMLQSEINALDQHTFLDTEELVYYRKLQTELNNRIEDECINDTQEV